MNKKGQTEIIGLMIIIILIVVVFLLYLKFSLITNDSLLTENVELASMLNAVLKFDFSEGSVKDMIMYCKKGTPIEGEDACVYVEEKVTILMEKIILDSTWNVKIFEGEETSSAGLELFKQIGEDCPGSNLVARREIMDQSIRLIVRLEKCRKI